MECSHFIVFLPKTSPDLAQTPPKSGKKIIVTRVFHYLKLKCSRIGIVIQKYKQAVKKI